jgi:hypothetical protein
MTYVRRVSLVPAMWVVRANMKRTQRSLLLRQGLGPVVLVVVHLNEAKARMRCPRLHLTTLNLPV